MSDLVVDPRKMSTQSIVTELLIIQKESAIDGMTPTVAKRIGQLKRELRRIENLTSKR